MIFREAINSDIDQIQSVRNSVTENTLSDPTLIPNTMLKILFRIEAKDGFVRLNLKLLVFRLLI